MDSDEDLEDLTELNENLLRVLLLKLECLNDAGEILLRNCFSYSDVDASVASCLKECSGSGTTKNWCPHVLNMTPEVNLLILRSTAKENVASCVSEKKSLEELKKYLLYKSQLPLADLLRTFPQLAPSEIRNILRFLASDSPQHIPSVEEENVSESDLHLLLNSFEEFFLSAPLGHFHSKIECEQRLLQKDIAEISKSFAEMEKFIDDQELLLDPNRRKLQMITSNVTAVKGDDESSSEDDLCIVEEKIENPYGTQAILKPLAVGQRCFVKEPSAFLWTEAIIVRKIGDSMWEMELGSGSKCQLASERIAYGSLPLNIKLKSGSRVLARHPVTSACRLGLTEKLWTEGTVGEGPTMRNARRYLVFFDDGCDAYVSRPWVRKIVEQREDLTESWKEVPIEFEDRAHFLRDFLANLPRRRRIALFNLGETIGAYKDGQWCLAPSAAILTDRDCSLVKVKFPFSEPIEEWIYHGSPRFEPINGETHILPSHVPLKSRIRFRPLLPPTSPLKLPESRSRREVAGMLQKATRPSAEGKNEYEKIPASEAGFEFHERCNQDCLGGKESAERPANASPFLVPIYCGWRREKAMGRKGARLYYVAPCGRRLRSLAEVGQYITLTESSLHLDAFTLDSAVKIFKRYKAFSAPISEDYSDGAEPVPIQVVNAVDHERPPEITYVVSRESTSDVVDIPLVCSGCSCTDNCASSDCECRLLTRDGIELLPKDFQPPKEYWNGYRHERTWVKAHSGIFECNAACACSSRKELCQNRVVQRGIRLPLQLFKTRSKGWGVRTLVDIPKGQFVAMYTGELISDAMADELGTTRDAYFANLDLVPCIEDYKRTQEEGSDGSEPDEEELEKQLKESEEEEEIRPAKGDDRMFSWLRYFGSKHLFALNAEEHGNIGRFLNHSCEPNLLIQNVFIDSHDLRFPYLALFAGFAINAGDELCWNYGYDLGSVPGKEIICHCGSAYCEGRIL